MITLLSAPAHVAAFKVEGLLESEDYDAIIDQLEAKLADFEEIGVFVDMSGFDTMTGEAIVRDLQYGISKLGELHRFKRAAVATDRQWSETMTKAMDTLFPQIEARVYSPEEATEAMRWVSGVSVQD